MFYIYIDKTMFPNAIFAIFAATLTASLIEYNGVSANYQLECLNLCNTQCLPDKPLCRHVCINKLCPIIVDTLYSCKKGIDSCVSTCCLVCTGQSQKLCTRACRNGCAEHCSGQRSSDLPPVYDFELMKRMLSLMIFFLR